MPMPQCRSGDRQGSQSRPSPAASRQARGGGRLGPVCRPSRPEHPKELEALSPAAREGRPACAGKPRGPKGEPSAYAQLL